MQTAVMSAYEQQQQGQPQYRVTDADRKRQQEIRAAWTAYEGKLDKPLTPMPGQADDNVMSNRIQAIVDRGVDFLFGKELEISVESGVAQKVQQFLDKTWGRKEQRIPLLQKLAMNGALAGQAFLRIVPMGTNTTTTFRLIPVDPSTVFVQAAPQDVETVLLYCIEYSTQEITANGKPQTITYREEIARVDPDNDGDDGNPFADTDATWEVRHWTKMGDAKFWTLAGPPIAWNYTFPPLFSCQNLPKPNDFWGYPDVTPDLIGLNQSLNLVQSSTNRILKLFGQPLIYGTGLGSSTLDISPGKIIELPLDTSKLAAVPLPSDVANALAFASNVRSDIDEQSSVPGVATGRIDVMPRGTMSGIAIELLFMPILKKTDKKRCGYGEMLIDVSQALLTLNNMKSDVDITLAWENALPSDDLATVQAAIAKKELGVSNFTLLRETGYDPDEEEKLSMAEDARKIDAMSAVQGIGNAQLGAPALPGQKYPVPAPVTGTAPAVPAQQQQGGHAA